MKLIVINGPNLNLLGKREPDIYGNQDFDSYFKTLQSKYKDHSLEYFQSNHEGQLIDKLHAVGFDCDGILINAGAFTHTSLALADAVAAIPAQVVEVHISNVHQRESVRHFSYLSPVANGIVVGFGLKGYELAILSLIDG